MERRKNIYLYIFGMLICGMVFTACGTQEISKDNLTEQGEEIQTNLFNLESLNTTGKADTEDVNLSEEQLYWIEHEERVTVLESPTRRFVEVRAINIKREEVGDGVEMSYFGMLKEADYEVLVYDKVPMLEIKFFFC